MIIRCSPVAADGFTKVLGAYILPCKRADVRADAADAAVGHGGHHDAGVQSLQAAIVATQWNRITLNPAGVDDAAIAVLTKIGITAWADAVGIGDVELIERGVVPPGIARVGRRIGRESSASRRLADLAY